MTFKGAQNLSAFLMRKTKQWQSPDSIYGFIISQNFCVAFGSKMHPLQCSTSLFINQSTQYKLGFIIEYHNIIDCKLHENQIAYSHWLIPYCTSLKPILINKHKTETKHKLSGSDASMGYHGYGGGLEKDYCTVCGDNSQLIKKMNLKLTQQSQPKDVEHVQRLLNGSLL